VRGRLLDLVVLAGGEGREEVLGIHVVSREKRGKFEALSQRKDKAISQVRFNTGPIKPRALGAKY
jgi:hypothetical protein